MHEHIEMMIQALAERADRRRAARAGRRRSTPPLPKTPRHRAWGEIFVSPFVHRHPRRGTFVAPS